MDIIIRTGWSRCEDCGSHDWYEVSCEELDYVSYYDGHLNGGPNLDEMLEEILIKLGHKVERVDLGGPDG